MSGRLHMFKILRGRSMPMPRNKAKSSQQSVRVEESSQHSSFSVGKDGSLMVVIQVKPGAKTDAITLEEDRVSVQISAPPVDGEANVAIVKYFCEVLKLRKSDVDLKGGKSRQKTIVIQPGTITLSECLSALQKESSRQ